MNRLVAVLAVLSITSAARAQDAAAPQPPSAPAAQEAQPAASESVDLAALKGQLDALAEQYAETRSDVSALKKLKISGYLQARWAYLEAASYTKLATATTPSVPAQDNFFIRRGRLKAAYDADWSQYVLQIDATPSGVGVKEAYAALKLPQGFAVDAGLQLMPFGYEVGVRSSADLDLLERAMVVKYFQDGEYDLGVALRGGYGPLNLKVGVFNGNGVAGKSGLDNDQLKDVIGRLGFDLGNVTGGVSGWYGKTISYAASPARTYDRQRLGADLQVYLELIPVLGGTALKGEYIWGKTGIGGTSSTGAGADLGKTSSGWYGLVTQNVGPWNQVAVRYEQFRRDQGNDALHPQKAVEAALHTFVGEGWKLSAAWFHPMKNEADADPKADQYILQAQAKF